MKTDHQLGVKIFADSADLQATKQWASESWIAGFTTNPTLVRSAGHTDYEAFAKEFLSLVEGHPVSFEVLADDLEEMVRQARIISSWGQNIYVKIPVTSTKGESTLPIVRDLSSGGVKVNVTAVFTPGQVEEVVNALRGGAPSNVSVFAGRIADAGVDPVPIMAQAVQLVSAISSAELIWASPREVLNVIQAEQVGCHIITMTPDLLKKLDLLGKDLLEFSLETVEMFHRDAQSAGLTL